MQWCEMHGDVAVAQMSEREHLLAAGRASALEYVPSPTEWSVGSIVVPSAVGAKWTGKMCCMQNILRQDRRCK